jgi:hypothetical protein
MTAPRWLGTLFVAVGSVCLLISVLDAWQTRDFIRRAVRTEGVVVALPHGAAHPHIEYKLPSGEVPLVPFGGSISYRKGQKVVVLYLPEDPWHPRLQDNGNLWFGTIVTGFLSLVFLAIGLFVRLKPW